MKVVAKITNPQTTPELKQHATKFKLLRKNDREMRKFTELSVA